MTNESEEEESPKKVEKKKEPLSYNPDLVDDQPSPKKKRKQKHNESQDSLFGDNK